MHESKYCFSPVHSVASTQVSSSNCIVNEPVGSELGCSGVKFAGESFMFDDFTAICTCL